MATTDLLTYYVQTDKINQVVEKYGGYLEQLDRETKLLLRMTLTQYVFMQEKSNPVNYTVIDASRDALFVSFICENIPQKLSDICSQLEGLTQDEAEALLEALQHQLRWGNARSVLNR